MNTTTCNCSATSRCNEHNLAATIEAMEAAKEQNNLAAALDAYDAAGRKRSTPRLPARR